MSATYTSSSLITTIRDYGYNNTNNPTDAAILRTINREQTLWLTAAVVASNAEYLVYNDDFTTTSGTASRAIPSRAAYGKVRDFQTTADTSLPYTSLPYVEPERIGYSVPPLTGSNSGWPASWYIQNADIIMSPTPGGAYAMRTRYYRRPSQIVSSGYSLASGLSGSSSPYTLTVASTTGMSTGNFDFVLSAAPFTAVLDSIAGTVVNATTLTLTLTSDQATTLTAAVTSGVYAVGAGDTPIPNMAPEWIEALLLRSAAVMQTNQSDPKAQAREASAEIALKKLITAALPREGGLGRKVVPRNAIGGGWSAGWGGWGP